SEPCDFRRSGAHTGGRGRRPEIPLDPRREPGRYRGGDDRHCRTRAGLAPPPPRGRGYRALAIHRLGGFEGDVLTTLTNGIDISEGAAECPSSSPGSGTSRWRKSGNCASCLTFPPTCSWKARQREPGLDLRAASKNGPTRNRTENLLIKSLSYSTL